MTSFSEKLNKLCKEMLNQGYNYASLKNLNNNSEFKFTLPSKTSSKPISECLYFSKIITEDTQTIPEWYDWITYENFYIDKYNKCDIIFAKFNENELKNLAEFKSTYFKEMTFLKFYDWNMISNNCNGIIVNSNDVVWDIHQIVIWNCKAIKDFKIYNNNFELLKDFRLV